MDFEQGAGMPSARWMQGEAGRAHAQPRSRLAAAPGLPQVRLLRRPSLEEFATASLLDAPRLPTQPMVAIPEGMYPEGLPPSLAVGSFGGPAGAIGGGQRQPFGAHREVMFDPQNDPGAAATLFFDEWGVPPENEFFVWDPGLRVYAPNPHPPSRTGDAYQDEIVGKAHPLHHKLAQRGIRLQAWRPGQTGFWEPWQYRWVAIDERPYRIVGRDYEALGHVPPTRAEWNRREHERERARARDGEPIDWTNSVTIEGIGGAAARPSVPVGAAAPQAARPGSVPLGASGPSSAERMAILERQQEEARKRQGAN